MAMEKAEGDSYWKTLDYLKAERVGFTSMTLTLHFSGSLLHCTLSVRDAFIITKSVRDAEDPQLLHKKKTASLLLMHFCSISIRYNHQIIFETTQLTIHLGLGRFRYI